MGDFTKEGWILTPELNVLNEKAFQSWHYENVIALLAGENFKGWDILQAQLKIVMEINVLVIAMIKAAKRLLNACIYIKTAETNCLE